MRHRHVLEIQQGLSDATQSKMIVSFTRLLMPMSHGMQSTIHVEMSYGMVGDLYEQLKIDYLVNFFWLTILFCLGIQRLNVLDINLSFCMLKQLFSVLMVSLIKAYNLFHRAKSVTMETCWELETCKTRNSLPYS